MAKKIIAFGVMTVMVFSLFAFSGCAPKSRGTFYSLEEAYEQGFLTQEDIRSIAYYQGLTGLYDEDGKIVKEWGEFVEETILKYGVSFEWLRGFPAPPIVPETLSDETEVRIKETYCSVYGTLCAPVKIENVRIIGYYGTYNGYVAVMISGPFLYSQAVRFEEIDGIGFIYSDSNKTNIWKEK